MTTNDAALARSIARLRNHGIPLADDPAPPPRDERGRPMPWDYPIEAPGWNYRVTDLQCALGLSQLARLEALVAERERLAARYDGALTALHHRLRPIARESHGRPAWHLYPVLCLDGPVARNDLFHFLAEAGIDAQVHYAPVSSRPYYRRRTEGLSLPGAIRYSDRVLSLPLFVGLADPEQQYVIERLHDFFGRGGG